MITYTTVAELRKDIDERINQLQGGLITERQFVYSLVGTATYLPQLLIGEIDPATDKEHTGLEPRASGYEREFGLCNVWYILTLQDSHRKEYSQKF